VRLPLFLLHTSTFVPEAADRPIDRNSWGGSLPGRMLTAAVAVLAWLSAAAITHAFVVGRHQRQTGLSARSCGLPNEGTGVSVHSDDEWHPQDPAWTTARLLQGIWDQIANANTLLKGVSRACGNESKFTRGTVLGYTYKCNT
jgi:hypothetical protein